MKKEKHMTKHCTGVTGDDDGGGWYIVGGILWCILCTRVLWQVLFPLNSGFTSAQQLREKKTTRDIMYYYTHFIMRQQQ